MSDKKKYTIYEIEKLTKGQLSKYKIKKAIKEGELVAEYLDTQKMGRGTPKYLISETALNEYLQSLTNDKMNEIKIKNESKNINYQDSELSGKSDLELRMQITHQQQELVELKNRIQFLETQNSKIEPILRSKALEYETAQKQQKESQEILLELANLNLWSLFSKKKKQDLLKRLNKLL